MMQQNRDRNGRPRNTRPYDLNRDVARIALCAFAGSYKKAPAEQRRRLQRGTAEPALRTANGGVRSPGR